MAREFPKAYEPKSAETKWHDLWQKNKIYKSNINPEKSPYSILMPPPNVTGILHFGHVLNHTLQDIFCRRKRMQGYEVCWFPGIDHAGIATQSKVEAQLRHDNISRYDLGREKFLEKVWEWKEKYGGIILKQLRTLGISCDWDRTLFTLDEGASTAVQEVFIRMFDEGLIYKGKRIINWSPLAQTAVSDEEVEFKEVNEQLYTLRYYFEDDNSKYLQVATVRTETIFGDIAVAVNPNDERYKDYIGKNVIVPVVGRVVPIIADEHADPEFGTGCVKITPAHDPNDFVVGERHDLEQINTINPDATMNENAGEFVGMDRFKARKAVLAKLKELDLIEKIEDYSHNVGYSQRGGEQIEPYLSDQWFVKMKPLAEIALEAVHQDEVKFYPNHWVKTYEHWMNNIRDWCISRQLWWGHRIPVYYTEDGQFTAAASEEAARTKLGVSPNTPLRRDEDVLDTWFSSWLWPMTTMNWLADGKEDNEELDYYLPTDLLVTAPDIIFFWVARMIMATKKFKKQTPFKDVYFTSLIRDGQGRKLSKSLGNSPDPLNIIDKYGTDAVRFTMIYLSPLGQDVKMDVDVKAQDIPSMELGRNFANKIWNAGRFLLMKSEMAGVDVVCPANEGHTLSKGELSFADKWIRSRFHSTIDSINKHLEDYKVNDYSKALYDFIWRDFCDWYVEIVKVQIDSSDSPAYKQGLMRFAIGLYEDIMKLLHPVMPFITEEIWHLLDQSRTENDSISLQAVPEINESYIQKNIEEKFVNLQSLVEEIRKLRASVKIPPQQKVEIMFSVKDEAEKSFLESQSNIISALAKCSKIEIAMNAEKPESSMASVIRETEIFLIMDETIDLDKERERLQKEIERLERNIMGSEKKLSNKGFVDKAPEKVVAYEREKLESMKESLEKVKANLENLG